MVQRLRRSGGAEGRVARPGAGRARQSPWRQRLGGPVGSRALSGMRAEEFRIFRLRQCLVARHVSRRFSRDAANARLCLRRLPATTVHSRGLAQVASQPGAAGGEVVEIAAAAGGNLRAVPDFAANLLNICRNENISVPEQLAMLSGGDDPTLCSVFTPPLSCVDFPAERVGYEAAALLHRLMQGGNAAAAHHLDPGLARCAAAVDRLDGHRRCRHGRGRAVRPRAGLSRDLRTRRCCRDGPFAARPGAEVPAASWAARPRTRS